MAIKSPLTGEMSSQGELLMEQLLKEADVPFAREHKFHMERKWRFDFVLLPLTRKIAIEVEGGVFNQGRHTRGKGFENDLMKYNAAVMDGWRVLRYSTGQVHKAHVEEIKELWAS